MFPKVGHGKQISSLLRHGEKEEIGSDFTVIVNSWKHWNKQRLCKHVEKEDMSNSQHRFSKNRAGQTQLIFCNEVINLADEGGGADVTYVGIQLRLVILCHMVSKRGTPSLEERMKRWMHGWSKTFLGG